MTDRPEPAADARTVPTTSPFGEVGKMLVEAGRRYLGEHPDELASEPDIVGLIAAGCRYLREHPGPQRAPAAASPEGGTTGPDARQGGSARTPAAATRRRAVMDDPMFETTVHALKAVLVPAMLVELQSVWQAALGVAEEERSGDGPIRAFGVVMSKPELEAEHDRILERCRAALPLAFDAAVPAAMDVMDAMLAARYLGLQIERPDRTRRAAADGENGAAPG